MKKFTFLLSLCVLGLGLTAVARTADDGDETTPTEDLYPVSFDKDAVKSDRIVTAVTLSSPRFGSQEATMENGGRYVWNDLTETTTWTVEAGEELNVHFTWSGNWMHGYVFIDTEGDGFTAGIDETDGFTPTGDLYSYAFFNGDEADSSDQGGWNSVGDEISGNDRNVLDPPAFHAPTVPGTYRMRLKTDWNSINPKGNEASNQLIVNNRGTVIDLMLEVKAAPVSIDEVCAAANEVLELVGVGYPTADNAARTTLQNALDQLLLIEDEATEADVEALYTAIDEYKSVTEGIQLPQAGKLYSFTMVAKNGNRFYLDYTGEDVALVERTADTEIPESAKFECIDNEDGTLSFKTNDGNYLVYHSKYDGVNWLEGNGSTTGFQAEKDDMANVTIAKLVNGNKVEAGSQADLFGLVSWYGKRGARTDNGNDEMGYVVIKADGSDYDGSSLAFWNDGFSSAFLMEEYEKSADADPATVEITPAPGRYDEGIPTTITMTFSKDLEEVSLVMARTSSSFRGEELPEEAYSLEGRVLTINVPADMLAGSEFLILVVEAKDIDGNFVENEEGEGMELIRATYTTELPHDTYTSISITPATDEAVAELSTFEVEFSNPNDDTDYIGGFVESNQIVLKNEAGDVVATATPSLDFDKYGDWPSILTLTLSETVNTNGKYTLVIPAKTVFNCYFMEDEEDYGESYGALYNPEITYTFTVEGSTGISNVSLDTQNKVVYTTDGRRVTRTDKLNRGVYIINGKKVIVK